VKGAGTFTAPTLEQLQTLKLYAMAQTWTDQQQNAELSALAFDERLGLLVEAEWLARENARLIRTRLFAAGRPARGGTQRRGAGDARAAGRVVPRGERQRTGASPAGRVGAGARGRARPCRSPPPGGYLGYS
jgi:hypothetical protein